MALTDELNQTLTSLESLLADEFLALQRLDHEAIEQATQTKLALCERLTSLGTEQGLGGQQRAMLERVRRAQLRNQLLVVHARDCVRGVLGAMGSYTNWTPVSRRPPVRHGLRVDLRG